MDKIQGYFYYRNLRWLQFHENQEVLADSAAALSLLKLLTAKNITKLWINSITYTSVTLKAKNDMALNGEKLEIAKKKHPDRDDTEIKNILKAE